MNYFIYQGNDKDCGFASTKMLLANYFKNKSYLYISKKSKKDSFTILDIQNFAKEYGLIVEPYTCDDDYFHKMKCPCLTLINSNHVVMVKKVSKKRIVYLDPNIGTVRTSKEKFLKIWGKLVCEIERIENVIEVPKIRRNILPLKSRIITSLFSLVSASILIATFYLLNDKKNVYYSFIFLAIFSSSLLIEKILLSKEVYQFDKKFIPLYFSKEENKTKLQYIEFMSFKQKYFCENRNLISSVLVAFTITFLLCLNDFRNMFVLLTLILLKTLEKFLLSKREEKLKEKIEISESKCFSDSVNCAGHVLRTNCLANEQILVTAIKNVFYIAISFGFSLAMMALTNNTGCNFVIFHFVLYYLGSNSLCTIIDSLSFRKELKKMESRFFDACNL